MSKRVLVAGAGGALGRLIVDELERRGHAVRAVVRRVRSGMAAGREVRVLDGLKPGAWEGTCEGVDVVVSALGASVDPSPLAGWRPYTRVDAPANLALLAEARRAGVGRFVYVSLIGGGSSRQLDYSEGHERVVDGLKAAGMAGTVLRPTGYFCAMAGMIDMARRGIVPVIGAGSCRTNPIDERDLASVAVDAVESAASGLSEMDVGGPEVFTRRRVAEMAFAALGKRARIVSLPAWSARLGGHALRAVNPRAGHFALFAGHIMSHECVGPAVGGRRLGEYFQEYARGRAARED